MGGVNLNKKLWRIPQQGMVKGVCAGIAHYLDVPVKLVRILVVLSIFFGLAFFTFVAFNTSHVNKRCGIGVLIVGIDVKITGVFS